MPYSYHPFRKERKCKSCKINFIAVTASHLYCAKCNPAKYSRSGLPNLTTATVGAIAELVVATDLLKRGFEVFRALSPSCSCDLAVLKDSVLKRIEVRSGYRFRNGNISTDRKNKADILAIVLHRENKIVYEPNI